MSKNRSEIVLHGSVGQALLEAGCIHFRNNEPFRLPSGWASPVYIDCRRLISFPALRHALVLRGLELLRDRDCLAEIDVVAGGESSGIPFAAWVADLLNLPMVYVRKEPRGIGPSAQIVGEINSGDRVLLVDDMMSAGRSKATFCEALASAGAIVKEILVLFDYGTFPSADVLSHWSPRVHSLATWRDVLEILCQTGDVPDPDLSELRSFLSDPPRWSSSHGGIAA